MSEHLHDTHHEMIVVMSGTIETQIGGRTLVGNPGDVLLYPTGQPHSERSAGSPQLRTLFVGWRDGGMHAENWPLIGIDRTGRIQSLVGWMLELFPPRSETDALTLDALMRAVAHEYAESRVGPEYEMVIRARRHVRDHLSGPIALDDLAEAACASKYYFSRVFRKVTGRSPMRFVAEQRVEAARTLLLRSPAPLRTIAASVGFSDEFQFSRVFRRITGHPPGAVRRERLIEPHNDRRGE